MQEAWNKLLRDTKRYDAAMVQLGEYRRWLVEQKVLASAGEIQEDDVAGRARLANGWLVGCDPEFVILNGDEAVNVTGVLGATGVVGYDHNGLVVEIRPQPAQGTYALVKRIQKEILEHKELNTFAKHKWRAGAAVRANTTRPEIGRDPLANQQGTRLLTLGGHVHLDLPPAGYGGDAEGHTHRIEALDRVTKHLEFLDILPKAESEARRTDRTAARDQNTGRRYGQFGDWRPAGERRTDAGERLARTEYRTMASWLYDPRVAFAALTLAKLAACAPGVAMDTLKPRAIDWKNVKNFVEFFRHRDQNARRMLEKMLDGTTTPKGLQFDPDVNFRGKWEKLGV